MGFQKAAPNLTVLLIAALSISFALIFLFMPTMQPQASVQQAIIEITTTITTATTVTSTSGTQTTTYTTLTTLPAVSIVMDANCFSPTSPITGTLKYSGSGQPASGHTVYLRISTEQSITTTSNANGRFSFPSQQAGTYQVAAGGSPNLISITVSSNCIIPPPPLGVPEWWRPLLILTFLTVGILLFPRGIGII